MCDVALMIGGIVIAALDLFGRALAEHELEDQTMDGPTFALLGLVGVFVFTAGALGLVLDARRGRADLNDVDQYPRRESVVASSPTVATPNATRIRASRR